MELRELRELELTQKFLYFLEFPIVNLIGEPQFITTFAVTLETSEVLSKKCSYLALSSIKSELMGLASISIIVSAGL
jgi:hypothetical protein